MLVDCAGDLLFIAKSFITARKISY